MTRGAAGREESGAAVPVAVGLVGVLMSLTVAGVAGGQVLVTQRRAAAAADLAALAAAVADQHGAEPCAAARAVAGAGGATVRACGHSGDHVRVVVEVPVRLVGRTFAIPARAEAGPR